MHPWIGFLIGLLVGSTVGLLVAALCFAARWNDDGTPPQDGDVSGTNKALELPGRIAQMAPDGSGA